MPYPIEPIEVVNLVDQFVEEAHSSAERASNITLLDESQAYDLHLLASQIYALAWDHATRAAEERRRARHLRGGAS